MKFIAYVTKGLEKISEKEIKSKISNAQILEVAVKRIIFESNFSPSTLTGLKTIDDIGILVYKTENTTQLISEINNINFEDIKKQIQLFRKIDNNDFSITASIVGINTNFKDLINSIASQIAQKYSWNYKELTRSDFDIRLFIDHKLLYLSVRLTKDSLHHRDYKSFSKIGSLKPTIAAALVSLVAGENKSLKVVDNFCGSGTILAEALLMGNEVYGGDIDPESVEITRNNLLTIQPDTLFQIKTLNAIGTNWKDNFFDAAISNLPWDKQIKMESITNLYIGAVKEFERIVKPGGKICLLTTRPEIIIKHAKKEIPNCKIEEIKIGLLGQTPTIV